MAGSQSTTCKRVAWATLLAAAFIAIPTLADNAPFALYDNMYYKGKPNTTADGFVVSNILYEAVIWPHKVNYGTLPDRSAYEAMVRAHSANPGPLVIDIEELPLSGSPDLARQHQQTLATLADWAHAAAPGKIIGYYGSNTLTRVAPAYVPYAKELAKHVDAFFPPAYTFDDDRAKWQQRAQDAAAEAHALDPAKPVYFYLWPQYHDKTPKQFQFVDAAYWSFQLDSASRLSNGIVIWSPGKFDWNDSTGWWSATQRFARSLGWRKP
jgi:hypothetical protein